MTPAMTPDLQLDADGRLRHLLTLDGLPAAVIEDLLDRAEALLPQAHGGTGLRQRHAGRTVCTLFFETSTRTRASFSLAATRLGADVLNFDLATSSTKKGESALDTVRTLEAMGVDLFVVRHAQDGAVAELAAGALPRTRFVNAGDGRSDLHALRALGCGEIRVCGPNNLLPGPDVLDGCRVFHGLDEAVEGVDVAMMLRLQRERMEEGLVPSLEAYYRDYGLSPERLARARPDAVVMHPGPMNRGVEIAGEVADGPQSLVLRQVANGLP